LARRLGSNNKRAFSIRFSSPLRFFPPWLVRWQYLQCNPLCKEQAFILPRRGPPFCSFPSFPRRIVISLSHTFLSPRTATPAEKQLRVLDGRRGLVPPTIFLHFVRLSFIQSQAHRLSSTHILRRLFPRFQFFSLNGGSQRETTSVACFTLRPLDFLREQLFSLLHAGTFSPTPSSQTSLVNGFSSNHAN